MLSTDSSLVRAFTKRRNTAPAAPPASQDTIQRRHAALRQMGLLPLSLREQEEELDRSIPTLPAHHDHDSDADRIKLEWVAKNTPYDVPLPPSPIEDNDEDDVPQLSHSPISTDSPESPFPHSLLQPHRSRSPSISNSRSRSRSRTSASPLRHSTPKLQEPTQKRTPQRKFTVFSRFKRPKDTLNPNPTLTRSKSLLTIVRKSVFGVNTSNNNAQSPLPPPPTVAPPTLHIPVSSSTFSSTFLKSFAEDSSSVHEVETQIGNPSPSGNGEGLQTDVVNDEDEKEEEEDSKGQAEEKLEFPKRKSESRESEANPAQEEAQNANSDPTATTTTTTTAPTPTPATTIGEAGKKIISNDPTATTTPTPTPTPATTIGKAAKKGISISLVLNRERKPSGSPSRLAPGSSPTPSPTTPVSPILPTRLRGRLGRKGTTAGGGGGEGLISVWGGLLLGAGVAAGSSSSDAEGDSVPLPPVVNTVGQERQALCPTIHDEASISIQMSNIEDEETRRVTEVAFM